MERPTRSLAEQLDLLSGKILLLGGLVEQAIGRSVDALVERDSNLAREVVAEDAEVDRVELEIDRLSMEILALKQPLARDLRFITTAMKITTDLERIGDLAVNVSERALELNEEPQLKPFVDIPLMARRAEEMVHGALDAFVRRDAATARAVIALDDDLDRRMEQIFRELLSFMVEDPRAITRALRLTFVAKYFERIGDQATNVCEQVVYMCEGRVIKHPWLSSADGTSDG
ncbi:MAG: phosphate signaling complex protein PhoU [Acidobacteriia bacterium]|nr:phosphate signaling complex protein PhoU [Terriglobia bacterium]